MVVCVRVRMCVVSVFGIYASVRLVCVSLCVCQCVCVCESAFLYFTFQSFLRSTKSSGSNSQWSGKQMNLICLGRTTRVCTVNAELQCKMAQSSRINTTLIQKQSLPHTLPRTPYRLAPLRNFWMFSLRMRGGIDEEVICGTKCHSHKYEIKTLLSDVL